MMNSLAQQLMRLGQRPTGTADQPMTNTSTAPVSPPGVVQVPGQEEAAPVRLRPGRDDPHMLGQIREGTPPNPLYQQAAAPLTPAQQLMQVGQKYGQPKPASQSLPGIEVLARLIGGQ